MKNISRVYSHQWLTNSHPLRSEGEARGEDYSRYRMLHRAPWFPARGEATGLTSLGGTALSWTYYAQVAEVEIITLYAFMLCH